MIQMNRRSKYVFSVSSYCVFSAACAQQRGCQYAFCMAQAWYCWYASTGKHGDTRMGLQRGLTPGSRSQASCYMSNKRFKGARRQGNGVLGTSGGQEARQGV